MNFKSRIFAVALSVLMVIGLTACGDKTESSSTDSSSSDSSSASVTNIDTDMFSEEDSDTDIGPDATKVTLDGKTLTVGKAGEYLISESIENGQIVVDADKNAVVKLRLNGVTITADSSAAIYVKKAAKVVITLVEGTENTLTTTGTFAADGDTNVDGVIFSKGDITVNGAGTLNISTQSGHGIVSKDDLIITGGRYDIKTSGHGIAGKDSVRIGGGSFTIVSEKDGIRAENLDDTSLGYYYSSGGEFDITSQGDGVAASGTLRIDGGQYAVTAGGGAAKGSQAVSGGFGFYDKYFSNVDDASTKGIKSTADMTIAGGNIDIDSADDSIHSNAAVTVSGGELRLASGDDAIHAETDLVISGGYIDITESYEGLEGNTVTLSGGETRLVSSDDGINAAGGNDESGFGGAMRPDQFGSSSDSFVKITDGKLYINASGDGIDSNGKLIVTGGETYVSGPTNSGNGALDYGSAAEISGGIFMAAGASGMATNFTSASGQGAMLVNTGTVDADQKITVENSKGKEILSYTFEKAYNCIVISSPDIKEGETYTVKAGGSETEVEMTSSIYGSSGGMGGMGGMQPGGMGGGRPGGRW